MRIKGCVPFLTAMALCLSGCDLSLNAGRSRIFVVQEIKLDDGRSLFWFRDEQEVEHEGLSYFQITNDKCDLSVKKALAYCSSPVQIYDYSGDTIFILTYTSLVFIRSDSWFSLKAVQYSPELYDSNKKPDSKKQFFLDSICSQK
jgi:hypothetical protein